MFKVQVKLGISNEILNRLISDINEKKADADQIVSIT